MVDKEQHTVLIFLDDLRESGIEGLTEAGSEVVFLRAILIDVGTQQDSAQRRTQRQGVDRRDTDSHRHGQTELSIEGTRRTTHERDRDEHRHEDQRRGDHGIRDTLHRIDTGHVGGLIAHVKTGLHRLHHDDRIIHHRTDHQHQGEQGDQVQAETGYRHEGEGTD